MRHRFIIAMTLIATISFVEWRWHVGPWTSVDAVSETATAGQVDEAYQTHTSGVIVSAEGKVIRTLADDTSGERHQRFIVSLPSGNTVLVAHNIDIAPRVSDISVGSVVKFQGEYVWSDQGGTVHWTHKDPRGKHEGGWIEYNGRRYE